MSYRSIDTRLASYCLSIARSVLTLSLVATAASCSDLLGPQFPANATPARAPDVFANWWQLTERCSGRNRDYAGIRWYTVPSKSRLESGGTAVDAVAFPDGRIVVKEGLFMTGGLVRHEMLHALLPNITQHPARYFQIDCAGVVSCDSRCQRDGGVVQVDTLNPMLESIASLEVDGHSAPQLQHVTSSTTWLSVVVGIRSRRSWPIRIAQASSTAGTRETYSVALVRAHDGLSLVSSGILGSGDTLTLPAFGRQAWVFDLNISLLHAAGRGELYRLVVGYLGAKTVIDSLVVP